THEPRAAFQLDDRDVKRRAEPFGRRVKRGERDDLADPADTRRRHRHGVPRAPCRRRRHDDVTARTPRGLDRLDHVSHSRIVTQWWVAGPPIECASATLPET